MSKLSLSQRIQARTKINIAAPMSESAFFGVRDLTALNIPAMNLLQSGDMYGGFGAGVSIIAGPSRSFKTLFGLLCVKAYLTKHPEAVCLFYDCEFGVTTEYLSGLGIDTTRVIHHPIEHIEQLKFEVTGQLNELTPDDKVIIFVDSLGAMASKKEIDDATEEKSVADMTRAKAIRSFLRVTTPKIFAKGIPCFIINHVYDEIGKNYKSTIMGGGTAPLLFANNVFFVSRVQDKDSDGELEGYHFKFTVEKSRFVREKSVIPLTVSFDNGISVFSGLMDLALEAGVVVKPKNGWYKRQFIDVETGLVTSEDDRNWRLADTNQMEFWKPLMAKNGYFNKWTKENCKLQTRPAVAADMDDIENFL